MSDDDDRLGLLEDRLRGKPTREELDEIAREDPHVRIIMRRLDDIEAQLAQFRWVNKRTDQMAKQTDNIDRCFRDARWLINGLVIGGLLALAHYFTASPPFDDQVRWVLYALAGGYVAFLIIRSR